MTDNSLWQINWSGKVGTEVSNDLAVEVESTLVRLDSNGAAKVLEPVEIVLVQKTGRGKSARHLGLSLLLDLKAHVTGNSLHLQVDQASVGLSNCRASIWDQQLPIMNGDLFPVSFNGSSVDIPCATASGAQAKRNQKTSQPLELSVDLPSEFLLQDKESPGKASSIQPLALELHGEASRLELISDIEISHHKGINTLGNFQSRFSKANNKDGEWWISDDGSVLCEAAKLKLWLKPGVDFRLFDGERELPVNSKESGVDGAVSVHLREIPHGRHRFAVELVSGKKKESLKPAILSDNPIYASLPVGRRFVKGVDVADGHLTHSVTDISLKARGLPLDFIRTYSNLAVLSHKVFPLGFGWTHNYNSWLEPTDPPGQTPHNFVVVGGEGSGKTYKLSSGSTYVGSAGYHGTLVFSNGGYNLTTPAGLRYRYVKQASDRQFFLESVTDLNGNQISLIYHPQSRLLEKVFDTSGGRYLLLTYTQQAVGTAPVTLLTSVDAYYKDPGTGTDRLIIGVKYKYDNRGNLESATCQPSPNKVRRHSYEYTINEPQSPHRLQKHTNPDKTVTIYSYKKPAKDKTGSRAALEQERISQVTEAAGTPVQRVTKFDYTHKINSAGDMVPQQTKIDLPDQTSTTYRFDLEQPDGTTASIEESGGRTTKFTWQYGERLLETHADSSGRVLSMVYNGPGNVTLESINLRKLVAGYAPITEEVGGIERRIDEVRTKYDYGQFGRIKKAARQDVIGNDLFERSAIDYVYDPEGPNFKGSLLEKREPEGRKTTFKYDGKGNVTLRDCTEGEHIVYNDFDAYGQPRTVKQKIQEGKWLVTTQTFDPRTGLLREARDEFITAGTAPALIRKVVTDYDELLFPRVKIESGPPVADAPPPAVRQTEYVYSVSGLLKEERTKDSQSGKTLLVKKFDHDQLGRLSKVEEWVDGTESSKLTREFRYDSMDRIVWEKDRRGVILHRHYDKLGRIDEVWREWPDHGIAKTRDTKYAYWGATNNPQTITDYQGNVTELHYDGLFHVVKRRLLSGNNPVLEEQFKYDSQGNLLKHTDPSGAVTKYAYDKLGQKRSETDGASNVKVFEYSAAGKIKLDHNLASGLAIGYEYDGLGRVIARTDTTPSDEPAVTSYAYDDAQSKVRITTPKPFSVVVDEYKDWRGLVLKRLVAPDNQSLAIRSTFQYNALGHLVESTDGRNYKISYQVDGLGRQRVVNYAGANVKELFTYDNEGNIVSHTDKAGKTIVSDYDFRGRLTNEWALRPPQNDKVLLRSITYDDTKRQSQETIVGGGVVTKTLDGLGRPVSVTHSLYPTVPTTFKYAGTDLVEEKDRKGNVTTYAYDGLHRRTRTTDAEQHMQKVDYFDSQNRRVITDAEQIQTIFMTDAYGRDIEMRRAGKRLWTRKYDSQGRLLHEIDGLERKTLYEYDAAGRLARIKLPGSDNRQIRYEYDKSGNRTKEWLSLKETPDIERTYDALGRISTESDAKGYKTEYQYDGEGRKTLEKDALQFVTKYSYNFLGQLEQMERDAGGINATYTYDYRDPIGRLSSVKDPTSREVQLDYDDLGRLTKRTLVPIWLPNQPAQPVLTTAFGYDENDNLTSVNRPDGSWQELKYNKVNKIKTITNGSSRPTSDPYAQTITYTYFNNNYLKSVQSRKIINGAPVDEPPHSFTYNWVHNQVETETDVFGRKTSKEFYDDGTLKNSVVDGIKVEYTYTPRRLPDTVAGPSGSSKYAYDRDDRPESVTLPGGFKTEYKREANGWISTVRFLTQSNQVIGEYAYDYDRVGNVLKRKVKDGNTSEERLFAHDHLHRLEKETVVTLTTRHIYDDAGRRIYTYFGDNLDKTYEHDGYGRLISVTTYGEPQPFVQLAYTETGLVKERWSNGRLMRFSYNPQQQLVQAQWGPASGLGQPIGTPSFTMKLDYDYLGRRIKRYGPEANRGYGHDNSSLVLELDLQSLKTTKRYQHSPGFTAAQSLVPKEERWLVLRDKTRSAVRIINQSTNAQIAKEYSALGYVLKPDHQSALPFGFAEGLEEPIDKDNASSSPLVLMGQRIYDPTVGCFLAPDPLAPTDAAGLSEDPYIFASNRPTTLIDPSGLRSESDDESGSYWDSFWGAVESVREAAESAWESVTSAMSDTWESAKREASDFYDRVIGMRGEASSDEDDERAYAPVRPSRTNQSWQTYFRSSASAPLSEKSNALGDEVEVRESRGTNENSLNSGAASANDQAAIRDIIRTAAKLGEEGMHYIWSLGPSPRGFALEILAGRNLSWSEPLADYLRAGEAGQIVVGQIKTTVSQGLKTLSSLTRRAARDAIEFAEINNLPRTTTTIAHIVLKPGATAEQVSSVTNALKDFPEEFAHTRVKVEVGLPGTAGKILKGLNTASGLLSAYELKEDIEKGDVVKGTADAAGVVAWVGGATPVGRVAGAYAAGYSAGTLINDYVLPESVQRGIGDSLYWAYSKVFGD